MDGPAEQRSSPAASRSPASGLGGEKPTVIYVMGAGRSGSTILGVALGNCDGVFFAGELNKWLLRRGTPSLDDDERVAFWRRVREQVPGAEEAFGGQASLMERSSALFSARGWRVRRRLRGAYRRVSEDLYRAIARASDSQTIVDTSHYPLRAKELHALEGIELYLLYVVRDPRQVVSSLARTDVVERSFGTFTANAYLWLTHLVSITVFLRHPRERRLLVRHEDFLADPERVLRGVLERVGSSAGAPDLRALRTGVPLHGNRIVRERVVSLDGELAPVARRSWLTTLLQLPITLALARLRPVPAARPRAPVKVVYVMGAGHSGSTIVGVALGNCAGVLYAGEVEEWVVNAGISGFGGSERTRFWKQVGEQVQGAEPLFGGEANRCIERSSSLFRIDRWRSRRRLRPIYLRVTQDLYRAIARVSGSECVVDSSHFPLRARELKRLAGIELYLLFLVREPQSLVWSYLKQVNRQDVAERRLRVLTTNLDLWLTYLVSVLVFLRHPRDRRIFVRYEDFMADPGQAVRQVLAPAGVRAELPDLSRLEIGVPLQGNNRLVRSEVVALKTGTRRPPRTSRMTALLQLPWKAVFSLLRPRVEVGTGAPVAPAQRPRQIA